MQHGQGAKGTGDALILFVRAPARHDAVDGLEGFFVLDIFVRAGDVFEHVAKRLATATAVPVVQPKFDLARVRCCG